tara:strand:- start:343 stop:615 length:273 start_codon:yes stop_codon:yes gene_type:complete
MPTDREREYYAAGYRDGIRASKQGIAVTDRESSELLGLSYSASRIGTKPKRKLSAWNKFVKANSNKKIYKYANGKLKLKKMGIAFRKKKK